MPYRPVWRLRRKSTTLIFSAFFLIKIFHIQCKTLTLFQHTKHEQGPELAVTHGKHFRKAENFNY